VLLAAIGACVLLGAIPTLTAATAPTTVAFTFSPDTNPVLSHEKITFSVTNPSPGVTYQWDFGEADATPGSASSPFVVHATGATVTHAYDDPAVTDTADNSHFGCPGKGTACPAPTHEEAVFVVRVQAIVSGDSTPVATAAQNIVVVPVQPPIASFEVVRSTGPNADAPVQTVTQPIAIVPQAELPEVDSQAQDQIVREDFWFTPAPTVVPGNLESVFAYDDWLARPDVTCLADGLCGNYAAPIGPIGNVEGPLVPDPSQLTPEPGEQTLAPGALTGPTPWADDAGDASTGGFGNIEMNFWDQALADIGSSSSPIQTLPTAGSVITLGAAAPVTEVGYPTLPSVNLLDLDGFEGEQGIFADCFPGYPTFGNPYAWAPCADYYSDEDIGPFDDGGGITDYAHEGEDAWNFLYNYATVVGVDTPLNSPVGPATGATAGPDGTTVPRTITMIAYDSEGIASAPVTQSVPLTPATGPTVHACIAGPDGCVPPNGSTSAFAAGQAMTVNVAGSSGGTGDIEYYAVQVGQPNSPSSCGSGPETIASPTSPAPFPPPPFSELEEGQFPYHYCIGYAERTVSSALNMPPQGPNTGPNTPVTASVDDRSLVAKAGASLGAHDASFATPPPIATDPNTNPQLYGSPVLIVPATEVAANPNALQIKFQTTGEYSVSVAAYDYSGLGAITRIDGIVVEQGQNGGLCQNVAQQPLFIGGHVLGLSGNCVTTVSSGSTAQLYASKTTLDIDGVPLMPQPGYSIVANVTNPSNSEIYVTNDCTITSTTDLAADNCPVPSSSAAGKLYLALGSASGAPGFAYWPNFSVSADTALEPTVAELPNLDSQAATESAVTGCGGSGGVEWTLSPSPMYDDLAVAGDPCITLTTGEQSRVAFNNDLPQGFGDGTPVTAPIVLQGADVPAFSQLLTTPYANVARAHRTWHVLDGGRIPASAADAGLPPIPGCGTNATSALNIAGNTAMGDLVDLPGTGLQMCYNSQTGIFTGNAMVSIPAPLPFSAEVGFEIGHGELLQAAANVSTVIQAGPITITDLKFDVQTQPVVVAGGLSALIGPISAQANLLVHTTPFALNLDGTVGIAGIQFGNFNLDFTSNNASMYAMIGKDFGPVSLNVSVSGGAEWNGPQGFQFYVDGNGSACLFICLGVQGLVSSDGLAACGSINLLVVKFSGGFAVLWKGPNAGLHIFTGCDLEPYIPAGLQDLGGPSGAPLERSGSPPGVHDAQAPATQTILTAGDTAQLHLRQPHGCLPTAVGAHPHCIPSVVAVQVHSLASAAGAGGTPLVTLTGPAGDPRVISTPAIPGSYGFNDQPAAGATGATGTTGSGQTMEGTALVDQNPIPLVDEVKGSSADCPTSTTTSVTTLPTSCPQVTTTTLYVADPGPGLWTLSVDPGSPPVVDVSVADSEPPVTRREFHAGVMGASVKPDAGGFIARIGGHSFSSSLLGARDRLVLAPSVELASGRVGSLAHPDAHDFDVPAIDSSRLRAILLKAPKAYKGTLAILDQGPSTNQVLASGLVPSQIPAAGLPILFEPGSDAGTHHIKVFLSNSEGMPSSVMTLSSYTAPPVRAPGGIKILRITRSGATVHITFNPGEAPINDGIDLTLSAGNGVRLHDRFTPGELQPIGPMSGVGAGAQAAEYMVTLHNIDPTESIKVGINGSNFGQFSPSATRNVGPAVHAPGDTAFLVKVRTHHRGRK
jgi:hypothetical protein